MYKSIITCVDDEADAAARVAAAIQVARHFDAYLKVIVLAYEPEFPALVYEVPPEVPSEARDRWNKQALDRAESLAVRANELLAEAGVEGEAAPVVSTPPRARSRFGAAVRFCDLAVLGKPEEAVDRGVAVELIEAALFQGAAATLICPATMTKLAGDGVLVAWNGRVEALRAVRRGIPMLRRAKSIEIAMVDPSEDEEASGAELAAFLSRHGLKAEVARLPRVGRSVSQALRQRVAELGADLLVMGAYSHSRARERVLGGVTRDILKQTPVTTLMAH